MKKHINIPIFIPHYGCPNACVFCNQKKITGKPSFDEKEVIAEINSALKTIEPSSEKEIAFFGGSFTALPREEMTALLKISDKYLENGNVSSVRLSTRPDAITPEILEILKAHGVKTIELGIQSFSDKVLSCSKRGHTSEDSEKACKMIKAYGFELIGQMMVGLPGSELSDELETAEHICSLGADGARVYPTVVFPETELENMTKEKEYTPLTNNEAAIRTAEVLDVFAKLSVPVIRIGLCSNETLCEPRYSENYHPSIGEIAKSLVFLKYMRSLLSECSNTKEKTACFSVAKGAVSQAVGQHRSNIEKLKSEFSINAVKVSEDECLSGYALRLELK